MIQGFNHNIKYKDHIFHIQTEDSGINNPHVITHLFVGGNIVDSRKMSYADIVKSDKLDEVIIELMQEQHKQMIKDLVSGTFDDKIVQRAQGAGHLNGPAPLNVARGQGKSSVLMPTFDHLRSEAKPHHAPAAPATRPVARPAVTVPSAPAATAVPMAKAAPSKSIFDRPEPTPSIFDTGRAAPARPPAVQLPTAGEAAKEPSEEEAHVINAASLQRAFESNNKAAINSIFGEDLISEKSLDEVILGYLAEDVHGS